jgi:hypothetical protein
MFRFVFSSPVRMNPPSPQQRADYDGYRTASDVPVSSGLFCIQIVD